ncbi:MAG: YhcH/YjgK/YiaL family protein [Desulfovibrionaceae bacterium]
MILDRLEAHPACHGLHPALARAFAFLERADLAALPTGRVEIDPAQEGESDAALYAVVIRGPGRDPDRDPAARIETHDRYADLQYVISGTDTMGWAPRAALGPALPREPGDDPRADVDFYPDAPEAWIKVRPGRFALFFPEDAHLPMIAMDGDGRELHKVVVKIRMAP